MAKIQLVLVGIIGLFALLGTVSATAATIQLNHTDFCLEPNGDNIGSVVVLRHCIPFKPDQQWSLHGGVIESQANNNACLDVIGAQAVMGTLVQIYNCNGNAAQQWTYERGALRSFGGSSLCLDVQWADFHDGATVWVWECNGGIAQDWRIE